MNCGQIQMEDIVRGNIATNVFMTAHYNKIRKSVKEIEVKNKLSATLTTKILMGTLGCVLAYDRYFIDGVKGQKVTTGIYNIKSLLKLVDFYDTNCVRLEETRKRLKVYVENRSYGMCYFILRNLQMFCENCNIKRL